MIGAVFARVLFNKLSIKEENLSSPFRAKSFTPGSGAQECRSDVSEQPVCTQSQAAGERVSRQVGDHSAVAGKKFSCCCSHTRWVRSLR